MTTTQAPVPLHPPVHPANVEPPAGVAVRVTEVPLAKSASQVLPQLIPAGLLVTVPLPVLVTDNGTLDPDSGGWLSVVIGGVSEPEQADNKTRSVDITQPRLNIVMPLSLFQTAYNEM